MHPTTVMLYFSVSSQYLTSRFSLSLSLCLWTSDTGAQSRIQRHCLTAVTTTYFYLVLIVALPCCTPLTCIVGMQTARGGDIPVFSGGSKCLGSLYPSLSKVAGDDECTKRKLLLYSQFIANLLLQSVVDSKKYSKKKISVLEIQTVIYNLLKAKLFN